MSRIVEAGDSVRRITTASHQILFEPHDESEPTRSVPAEDIGLLMLDGSRCSVSTGALRRLAAARAAVVVTDDRHLPAALLLPLSGHTLATKRIAAQANSPLPRRKQAWKQIVQAKIRAQARNLVGNPSTTDRLLHLAETVRSGDPDNAEAVAASLYWPAFSQDPNFRRRPQDASDPRNVFLDYGYGVLRATCARALVKAGLHPALGIHHKGRDNPYCLADDLMEPLRPIIDRTAFALHAAGVRDLGRDARADLLRCLHKRVRTSAGGGPLDAAIERYAAALALWLSRESDSLDIPEPA